MNNLTKRTIEGHGEPFEIYDGLTYDINTINNLEIEVIKNTINWNIFKAHMSDSYATTQAEVRASEDFANKFNISLS